MLDFINEIAPIHDRTSCNDDVSNGNEYCSETGYPRCVRCALLYRLRHGEWPYGASARVEVIRYGRSNQEPNDQDQRRV